jgi:hypothetical protein
VARAGFAPLDFDGVHFGGVLMTTTNVENFPGFRHGVDDPGLVAEMRAQARRFGAMLRAEDAWSWASRVVVAFGHQPAASSRGQVDLEDRGYVVVRGRTSYMNVPGCSASSNSSPPLPAGDHSRGVRRRGDDRRRTMVRTVGREAGDTPSCREVPATGAGAFRSLRVRVVRRVRLHPIGSSAQRLVLQFCEPVLLAAPVEGAAVALVECGWFVEIRRALHLP